MVKTTCQLVVSISIATLVQSVESFSITFPIHANPLSFFIVGGGWGGGEKELSLRLVD